METFNKMQTECPWKISTLRFTFFPKENFLFDENLWIKLFNNPPENITQQPKFKIMHYEGKYDSGNFVIDIDPIRVSIIYISSKNSNQFISLGEFKESKLVFQSIIERWFSIKECPIVNRIGFGGIFLIPVLTKVEGYKTINKFLPSLKIDVENSTDLLYQINRPRRSTVNDNLIINRLMKWSVFNLEASIDQPFIKSQSQKIVSREIGVRLEFDINTHVDYQGQFSPEQQKVIFDELNNLGDEISEKGDIE